MQRKGVLCTLIATFWAFFYIRIHILLYYIFITIRYKIAKSEIGTVIFTSLCPLSNIIFSCSFLITHYYTFFVMFSAKKAELNHSDLFLFLRPVLTTDSAFRESLPATAIGFGRNFSFILASFFVYPPGRPYDGRGDMRPQSPLSVTAADYSHFKTHLFIVGRACWKFYTKVWKHFSAWCSMVFIHRLIFEHFFELL